MTVSHADAQELSSDSSSLTTAERVDEEVWWPTKGDAPRSDFVGTEVCAECHRALAQVQATTSMYHASVLAENSEILKVHKKLTFAEGGLHYTLDALSPTVNFEVSDGTNINSATALWGFGNGVIGQTFILAKGQSYMESRLSYFTSLGALDITIGHSAQPPANVEKALGHVLDNESARGCFSCHTTGAVAKNNFEPEKAQPGIQCEACHGPGGKHVSAARAHEAEQARAATMNPARLAPAQAVDFCGACHRTWADVVLKSTAGMTSNTLRFQPYLLENSRCWGKNGDARLTCMACHDPHQPLVREAKAYDGKCLACHTAAKEGNAKPNKMACRVGTSNCSSCHMPKLELPQSHAAFTDHTIRVVRNNH